MAWAFSDIPKMDGKTVIVTGANSGIGAVTARELGRAGATVILACRNAEKAKESIESLLLAVPAGDFRFLALDLADLASVRRFTSEFKEEHANLDLLINNAGVMVPPYSMTQQGFEMQLGTNHLGHFALTGLLIDRLTSTAGSRVVNVASNAHKFGRIQFDDLQSERRYRRWAAYGQSKVANLLFHFELGRRLSRGGHSLLTTAAHPGWTRTNLMKHTLSARVFGPLLAMGPDGGAKPTLRAAVDPSAAAGDYFGPKHAFQMRGAPVLVSPSAYARRDDIAKELWDVSTQLTGIEFSF